MCFISQVQADDIDDLEYGGTITYKFISTTGEKERFRVDPNTGIITTADVSIIYYYHIFYYYNNYACCFAVEHFGAFIVLNRDIHTNNDVK